MGHLFLLSDEQKPVIEPLLPRSKVGCRWCDWPREYGPSTTIYNRFNRWSRKRFWGDLCEALAASGAVTTNASNDSTYVKAHRSANGGKGGEETGDRPRHIGYPPARA